MEDQERMIDTPEELFLEYMKLDNQFSEYTNKHDEALAKYNEIKIPAHQRYLDKERIAFLEYEDTVKESLKIYENAQRQLKEFKKLRTTERQKYLNSRKPKISKLRNIRK